MVIVHGKAYRVHRQVTNRNLAYLTPGSIITPAGLATSDAGRECHYFQVLKSAPGSSGNHILIVPNRLEYFIEEVTSDS